MGLCDWRTVVLCNNPYIAIKLQACITLLKNFFNGNVVENLENRENHK